MSAVAGSNTKTETGITPVDEVCRQLGIGSSGFLKPKEFFQVCKHCGLHSLKKKEQMQLFKKMDTNKDGLISLTELESGLHMVGSIHSPSAASHSQTLKHSQSQKTRPPSLAQARGMQLGSFTSTSYQLNDGETWLFSSVAHSEDGTARSEDIVDLWDRLGVVNGSDILLTLGFNPDGEINLSDLTSALNEVIADVSSSNPVSFAAIIGYHHELRHLRSALEETVEEKKKLQQDLAKANAYNSLLAIDMDDSHSQLDKYWESKLVDTLGNIKDAYWTVDAKYQEQIRGLKSELENERETKAAELSRIIVSLDNIDKKSSQERQQLLAMLANSQKEIEQQDQALAESKREMLFLSKQNESLKRDLQNKLQLAESAENQAIQNQQHVLANTSAENKKLKDDNDELIAKLEQTKQMLYLAQRRIDLLTSRLSTLNTFQEGSEFINSSEDFQLYIPDRRHINLSTELSQSEIERMIDSELSKIERAYRQALTALEEKHLAEKKTLLENFEQDKKCLISEQKNVEAIILAEQQRNFQTAYAHEKNDLIQKHENEKSCMIHQHQQEIAVLQERLLQAQSRIEDNTSLKKSIHHLEAEVAKCKEDIQQLENRQKSECAFQLQRQEMTLRSEFEEERKKLEKQCKLQEISCQQKLNGLFERGIEALTGKLKDDFCMLVSEYTEREVRKSQAVLLNQLQKDREDMVTAAEEEKCQIYEKADSERETLVAKYEMQIASLKTELKETQSKLEAEKQMVSEMSLKYAKDSIASENALETLRKTMERELLIELERITENFESEKRELENYKFQLEEKLAMADRHINREKQKCSEIDSLKETVRVLTTEKKGMETIIEEMKEKLFHSYRQMNVEHEDVEVRLKAVKEEAESQGRMEGLVQGRKEGLVQGRKQAYEEFYKKGLSEGREEGCKQGKKGMDTSMKKSLEAVKTLAESLKRENAIMEKELKEETEKNDRYLQQLHCMDQLQKPADVLLTEKQALKDKCADSSTALAKEHEIEKDQLLKLGLQKAHVINLQLDKKSCNSQVGSIQQGDNLIGQMTVEQDATPTKDSGTQLSEDSGSLKEQTSQLCHQSHDTFKVQQELDLLKNDYNLLLKEKSQLEETFHIFKSKAHETDSDNVTTQLKTLSEEKQKLQALLDQTSDQLAKVSTSMALAQSKFVRELELMKQKAKQMVEVESYTKLQINLVEHQRLVITLQDAQREREAVIAKFIKHADAETWKVTRILEAKVKGIQSKLELTQEELTKYKEKYTQISAQMNQRNLVLKDLYLENSNLMKALADSKDNRKQLQQQNKTLNAKLDKYRKTLDTIYESMSREI